MLQNFVSLLSGFQVALAPENIGACLLGAVLGLVWSWALCPVSALWRAAHCCCP